MANIKEWRDGQAVKGTYCGIAYSGFIADNGPFESRMGPRGTFIYVIKLAETIMVFGQERTRVEIWDSSKDDSVVAA